MAKLRKKSKIVPISQVYQFQDPKKSCHWINVEHHILDGWKIKGRNNKKEFIFSGYINREDLCEVKAVLPLLTDAIDFMAKEMRKEAINER